MLINASFFCKIMLIYYSKTVYSLRRCHWLRYPLHVYIVNIRKDVNSVFAHGSFHQIKARGCCVSWTSHHYTCWILMSVAHRGALLKRMRPTMFSVMLRARVSLWPSACQHKCTNTAMRWCIWGKHTVHTRSFLPYRMLEGSIITLNVPCKPAVGAGRGSVYAGRVYQTTQSTVLWTLLPAVGWRYIGGLPLSLLQIWISPISTMHVILTGTDLYPTDNIFSCPIV